ncbi:aminotransferase class V-fold PLP-dependent enzyme [Qipengyuania nanhaisediminis]|uniref:aminotransferase class V-fold PLP-dependent enzyme n=1 Tax=Qipengyuania nanhaisediminis TaxID=604088 RepID=UPI0038B3ED18
MLPADLRADFPGLRTADGAPWHYLDTAATAQKPRAVIDAMARAMGEDYATVHRGVYARSANMTAAYEAAREAVARFVGGRADELIFTRGATEAINLVAQSWGRASLRPGDRIMLSQLEHHSNIVPWQLVAEATGAQIDVVPLTDDHRIDLEAAEAMITKRHKMVAFAHVSNVLGSVLDTARAAAMARSVGAKLLLDGCQAVPRLPLDLATLDCDFYAFSAHKLYGPTGIGALWVRGDLLESGEMLPYQGGGAMIDRVAFTGTTFAPGTQRFEAGTPAIAEAIAFHAAVDYVGAIGVEAIHALETRLTDRLRRELLAMNDVTVFGPTDSAGIVSFAIDDIHSHDLGTILDEAGVAIRAGHHCAQPLMDYLGVPATARASFGLYSADDDIDALLEGIARTRRLFGKA